MCTLGYQVHASSHQIAIAKFSWGQYFFLCCHDDARLHKNSPLASSMPVGDFASGRYRHSGRDPYPAFCTTQTACSASDTTTWTSPRATSGATCSTSAPAARPPGDGAHTSPRGPRRSRPSSSESPVPSTCPTCRM